MAGIEDHRWYFSQVKGTADEEIAEADVISCVEFNRDGELLATGDKGGRIVIFKRHPDSKNSADRLAEYAVYTTFQSHEPEFDYLKSLEIEEKINKIEWIGYNNQSNFLLSTNDKTVKLWRVSERYRQLGDGDLNISTDLSTDPPASSSITALTIPTLTDTATASIDATPRRVYANAHAYHINSISVNSDLETFISADDLRLNLWHLDITDQSFNIVDIKPVNMEELTEVITAACFHPSHCNILVYSSSKGTLRLCDLRSQALCDQHSKLYEEPEDPATRSFFSEIISSISDVKFSRDGRFMVTRDYLTVKVWDVRRETSPVETYQVNEYLRGKLCALYENDCIFDKFEACWSANDRWLLTGSYNNFFCLFDRHNPSHDLTLEATRLLQSPSPPTTPTTPFAHLAVPPKRVTSSSGARRGVNEVLVESLDFNKKILHSAWHPSESVVAIAATNNLFIYHALPK